MHLTPESLSALLVGEVLVVEEVDRFRGYADAIVRLRLSGGWAKDHEPTQVA